MMDTAKIFKTGRSQAVRLPKKYRFEGEAVRIRKHGNAVILEPMTKGWAWLDNFVGGFDADAAAYAEEDPGEQERPALDEFFK